MDFWSRLIGGSGRQVKPSSPKKISPQQRLERFKRAYASTLRACTQPHLLVRTNPLVERLLLDLRQLATLLREELRSPAPYQCLAFSASSQIYIAIGRAASACKDDRIISETVVLFSVLVDSEMEGFVSDRAFARSLMRFSMRVLEPDHGLMTSDAESQLVEVLFAVAAKIRLEPDILETWFAPSGRAIDGTALEEEKKSFVGITQKDDFPLCYLFIDRVHHEGRIGDFARTALLYIFEAASRSPLLDAWIVASDLPTLMASALGALYSQLSRELSLLRNANGLPMLLAMSDYLEHNRDTGVEAISSASHKSHMSTFLSDLTFWQDILDHCQAVDVKQTLLDHFQILFLQQLLYPSLLQSSDTDGGSSVAVMVYLNSILQTLTDESLSNMLLNYLLGIQRSAGQPPSPSVSRRRSSLMTSASVPSDEDRLEPSLFNLVDLIHNGMQSRNPQAIFAALTLFTTILTVRPSHAFESLVRVTSSSLGRDRTISSLQADTSVLLKVAASIGGSDGINEAFSGASADVRQQLDAINVKRARRGHDITSRNNSVIYAGLRQRVSRSSLDLNETGLKTIIALIANFLVNGVDVNLALTETTMALCTSIDVDLSGLLASRPERPKTEHDRSSDAIHSSLQSDWLDDDERGALSNILTLNDSRQPDSTTMPILQSTFQKLETQVNSLRDSLSRFDALLSKRKAILQMPQRADNLFESPVKPEKPLPRTPAMTMLRNASPGPKNVISRPVSQRNTPSHTRQASITSLHNPPPRTSSLSRGRQPSFNAFPATLPADTNTSNHTNNHNRNNSFTSPTRSPLNANVFRPPPPEANAGLSPPKMAPLRVGALSPPKYNIGRIGSLGTESDGGLSPTRGPPFLEPRRPFNAEQGGGRHASPTTGGENDAETLNLRVRFNSRGEIIWIGPRRGGGGGGGPPPPSQPGSSGAISSRARSPMDPPPPPPPPGRPLRSEALPGSSRGSSVQGEYEESSTGSGRDTSSDDDDDGEDLYGGRQQRAGQEEEEEEEEEDIKEVSLSHVLTNTVVLQNFILELVAVLQQRAIVYEGELRFWKDPEAEEVE